MQIKFYVPSTANGESISSKAFASRVAAIVKAFSKRFGGATVYSANGAWIDDNGKPVYELVQVVETYVTANTVDEFNQHADWVKVVAANAAKNWSQSCVAVVVDNEMHLLS